MHLPFMFCALLMPLGSALAQGTPAPQPTDPAAPVPAVSYRSVFADLPAGVETGREDWKKANNEVGRFTRGHADILKAEPQAATARPADRPAAQPAAQPHTH